MMRPEEIALALLRRWWIVALAALAAATIAYIGTASQPSTYVVSTRIMAIAEPPDYWMDLYAKNRLASYRDLINNWEFITGSLQEAGSDIDPGVAHSKLALGHNPDSNIVQIVVTDTEPQRAATIANALADGFVRRNEAENERQIAQRTTPDNQFPGRVTMEKLETPAVPTVPSGPRVRVNTLAGGVLGAVAGLMVAFGTIYLDDTLKTRRDLERYLKWPVLGTIPPTPGDK
ncbi:MAG: lipopolysaccharide biosynthesis protein [Chloroflexota bacterium]|nr:lipopolysaccharide biosynthesis protein [Chloroflexota bacterium]